MDIQDILRVSLVRDFRRIPHAMAGSKSVHLEVWESIAGRPVGVEFNTGSVGLWIKKMHLHRADIPASVSRVEKVPKGRGWIGVGEDKQGANSNLSAYGEFRTSPLSHLLVRSADDLDPILGALCRQRAA